MSRQPVTSGPAGSEVEPSRGLRATVAMAGLSAVLAPSVAGALPAAAALVAVAALGVAVVVSATGALARARGLRGALGGTVVVGTAAGALALGAPDLSSLQPLLAVAVTGLLVAQQLMALTVRDLMVGVAASGALLLHTVGTAPTPWLGPLLLTGWVSGVTAVVLVRSAGSPGRLDPAPAPQEQAPVVVVRPLTPSGTRSRAVGVVVVSVVSALLAVLLLPQPDGSAGAQAARRAGLVGAEAPASSRTSQAYAGQDLDMRARGDLPRTPVVDVPADSPRLWRAAVLTDYDGLTWRSADGGQDVGRLDGAWDVAAGLDNATGPAVAANEPDRYDVRLREGFGAVLLAPGHALTVRPDRGGVLWASGGRAYLDGGAAPTGYDVTVLPTPDATEELSGAPSTAVAPGRTTALPTAVTARTRQLALEVTAGATTTAQAVRAVEAHLRSSYTYDLDSPVPPAGQDAVDHFLFDARSGFCEQFAAAEVVMLRSLGIPARMATGYSGGTADGDRRVVTADRAHAWVEVHLPGAGWLPSDPTPASDSAAGGWSLADWVRSVLADQERRLLAAAAVVAVSLLGWGLVALARRRRGTAAAARAGRSGRRAPEVVEALDRLVAALAVAGTPSPPAETLTELGRRLPAPADEALALAERVLYGPGRPNVEETLRAVRMLDRTTAGLLAVAGPAAR